MKFQSLSRVADHSAPQWQLKRKCCNVWFQSLSRVADHSALVGGGRVEVLAVGFNPSVGLPIIRPTPTAPRPASTPVSIPQSGCRSFGRAIAQADRQTNQSFNPSVGLPIIRPRLSDGRALTIYVFQSLSRVADHSAGVSPGAVGGTK